MKTENFVTSKNKIKKPFAGMQNVAAVMMCVLLFTTFGCENGNKNYALEECFFPLNDGLGLDCPIASFQEGVSRFPKCCNTYIIKGIVEGKIEYGLNIKFVEDLKGNFPKNVSTFNAWGDNGGSFRYGILSIYDISDVLIMHLIPVDENKVYHSGASDVPCFEKPGDFCTFPCTVSVLKFSDGYVSGHILPNNNQDILPWKVFQKLLNELLKNK